MSFGSAANGNAADVGVEEFTPSLAAQSDIESVSIEWHFHTFAQILAVPGLEPCFMDNADNQ